MAFTLFGKVQVDNQGVYRAFQGMKTAVGPAGKQIGQQLRWKILEAFGAAGGIAIFKKSLQKAFDLRKDAGGLGIATDTLQTLQILADQTGASIESMVEKMASGTTEGDAFAEAVKKMNEQMLEQGRIIDSGTVGKLANAFEKIAQLMGRIAPGIAWVTDKIVQLYDLASKGVEHVVGSVQSAYGRYRGDEAMTQAGEELRNEAFSDSKPEVQSTPETEARVLATAIAKADRENKSKDHVSKASSDRNVSLPVSSDTGVGRFFGAPNQQSATQNQLQLLNSTVADINTKIALFK